MGYWKKPGKYHCKKECKPYIQLYTTEGNYTTTEGNPVRFDECGPECGFSQCRNDIIVDHEGVYFVSFTVDADGRDDDYILTVNGAPQNNTEFGNGLLCLKCGDKLRLIAYEGDASYEAVSLTIFKVN